METALSALLALFWISLPSIAAGVPQWMNPKVFTFGLIGEKAQKNKGRPQRYNALIEVTDGKSQQNGNESVSRAIG
jgi:hypothetical protein